MARKGAATLLTSPHMLSVSRQSIGSPTDVRPYCGERTLAVHLQGVPEVGHRAPLPSAYTQGAREM